MLVHIQKALADDGRSAKPVLDETRHRGHVIIGTIAVISGGGTGIGLASMKRFIAEGAFLCLFGRRAEKLEAAVAALGGNVRAVPGPVSDAGDLDRLYDTVKQEHGKLDILFANAGLGRCRPCPRSSPTMSMRRSTSM